MLLIYCPYCEEERSELEFRQAGDAHIARPTNITELTDEEFEAFFFLRDNVKGLTYERWRHLNGCGRFFNAARDTVSDKFVTTYKAGLPKPDISTLRPATEATVETYEATESNAK
ncbi:sarcosine oxidase subunit delta [Rhizobium herbae]|uniref:Sarcosine oxidase subunit delta n=1 Tax=Rhizobium herbae TaxID=508661 RepID=A0ABS7HF05_9HYPH|nr:sarcosine oxidase subunit delta [Rhizobium herbae]MBW9065147.1 sarcosine oxidase subunit delta [Rhizobium herbae]